MKQSEKDLMYQRIENHGAQLQKIFPGAAGWGQIELCKKLRRLETRAHRLAEDYCNGQLEGEAVELNVDNILAAVRKVLGTSPAVMCNLDPRGYALKIDDEIMRANGYDLSTDWGGYGIIAPEFDGKR